MEKALEAQDENIYSINRNIEFDIIGKLTMVLMCEANDKAEICTPH
jgi:hypothetical protein